MAKASGSTHKPATLAEADALCKKLINRWVILTLSVSWVPGASFVLMGTDYKLYHDIAAIYCVRSFNIDAVTASATATLAGRGSAELLTFVVGAGWVIKAGIAAGTTKALCEAVKDYMRGQSQLK
jgi:hypothetical protein